MAEPGNIAIPTLTGMMLDRGTKTLDKFAIAEKLDNVGAEISFSVGAQILEVRAKCLKKDLPLVLGLIAGELRTPPCSPQEFAKAKQQFIGVSGASAAEHRRARPRGLRPRGVPGGSSEPAARDRRVSGRGQVGRPRRAQGFSRQVLWPGAHDAGPGRRRGSGGDRRQIAQGLLRLDAAARITCARRAGARRRARAKFSVPLADKPSMSVILGQPTGLRYRDPDALALRVGTAILGQGFTGRLMGTVRDREGLTYKSAAGWPRTASPTANG